MALGRDRRVILVYGDRDALWCRTGAIDAKTHETDWAATPRKAAPTAVPPNFSTTDHPVAPWYQQFCDRHGAA